VFRQRLLSLPELVTALIRNFQGQEVLRQRILHGCPKLGGGDPRAEELMLRVVGMLHERIANRRNVRGGRYRLCFYSYGNHVLDGLFLGATPDGRLAGEPISNGVSPSNLIPAMPGPHTAMRAVARIPPQQSSSGLALNLRFHPRSLAGAQGLEGFAGLLSTYFRMGGMQIQPNVVSGETLRDAQAHPERYRDLVVKVSGYSAYFTDLGRSIQDDIIARHEFGG